MLPEVLLVQPKLLLAFLAAVLRLLPSLLLNTTLAPPQQCCCWPGSPELPLKPSS